ncbi:MAG: RNA-binding protein [Phycisphaeraceae bacterium]
MKIYVGNLNFRTTQQELEDLFTNYGSVQEAAVVTDRETGRSRGFGFVTMPDAGEANAAIEALNGTEIEGRTLTVNEARPKTDRPRGGGYGNRGGGRDRW